MKNKRKRYLVDQAVQGGIAVRFAVYWLCSIAIAFAMMVVIQCILDPFTPFLVQLGRAKTAVFPIAAATLLLLPVILYDLTKLTNRFAGPALRLKQAMRELRSGTFQGELRFRDGDYWQDLADEFNRLARYVEKCEARADRVENEQPLAPAMADV